MSCKGRPRGQECRAEEAEEEQSCEKCGFEQFQKLSGMYEEGLVTIEPASTYRYGEGTDEEVNVMGVPMDYRARMLSLSGDRIAGTVLTMDLMVLCLRQVFERGASLSCPVAAAAERQGGV
jgi:hypothetical protein